MNASTLIDLMNQEPFQPLEVRLNNGQSIKIDEPYHVAVQRSRPTFIVFDDDEIRHVAYRNVAEVISRDPAAS